MASDIPCMEVVPEVVEQAMDNVVVGVVVAVVVVVAADVHREVRFGCKDVLKMCAFVGTLG